MADTTRVASTALSPGQSMMGFTKTVEGHWSGPPTQTPFEIETDFTQLKKEDVLAAVVMGDISATHGDAGYRAEITDVNVIPSTTAGKKSC